MGTKTFDPLITLGLYTETALHCGAEATSGYVDLPIQRERHTDFPVIPGSTLKGVFKDEMRSTMDPGDVQKWFGIQDAAGQISFGDGIVVAFPVRSTGQPFHWVTCPFVLERTFRAMQHTPAHADVFAAPATQTAWAQEEGDLVVEELRVIKKRGGLFTDEEAVRKLLSLIPDTKAFEYTRGIFAGRLLVVSDDDFHLLTETGTEIVTRIKLNILGTTKNIDAKERAAVAERLAISPDAVLDDDLTGNMFVQEIVPSETLFLTTLRSNGAFPLDKIPPLVRIGGDETIGRGLTRVTKA